jgi:hypothetical protein
MKTSSKVVKHSKILWIVLIFFLSSCKECNKCNEEQTLEVYRSRKDFLIYGPKNIYVFAYGIWKVTGDNNNFRELVVYKRESIDVPHSVEIDCDKPAGYCKLRETVLVQYGNYPYSIYSVSSSDNIFEVNTWDNDKIIATMGDFHDRCLKRILQIDLHTQEVLVKSIPKDNMNLDELCSRYKDKPTPIINKLVDESESDWEYFISVTKKPKTKK